MQNENDFEQRRLLINRKRIELEEQYERERKQIEHHQENLEETLYELNHESSKAMDSLDEGMKGPAARRLLMEMEYDQKDIKHDFAANIEDLENDREQLKSEFNRDQDELEAKFREENRH